MEKPIPNAIENNTSGYRAMLVRLSTEAAEGLEDLQYAQKQRLRRRVTQTRVFAGAGRAVAHRPEREGGVAPMLTITRETKSLDAQSYMGTRIPLQRARTEGSRRQSIGGKHPSIFSPIPPSEVHVITREICGSEGLEG